MTTAIPKTAAYGSGILYPSISPSLASTIKTAGIDILIVWAFHVKATGDIAFNDTLIISFDQTTGKSNYVGDANWPTVLSGLMGTGSTISQMEASIGGYTTNDFLNIKNIYNNNNNSFDNTPLKSNFELFKKTFPMITLIDMDAEGPDAGNYDQDSFVAFCKMLIASDIGFDITFCPYENNDFWVNSLQALNGTSNTGPVKWWNLQCYAGGGGNTGTEWAGYITQTIPAFNTDGYILVSDSSRYYNTYDQQWEGDCVPAFTDLMSSMKGETSVSGAFLWNIDQVEDYAASLKKYGPDPEECSSTNRSLKDYLGAITKGLGQ